VNFDKRYWIFIASASTLSMAPVQEHFMECNSVSAACFAAIGMVPCMVTGVLALLPLMGCHPVPLPAEREANPRAGAGAYVHRSLHGARCRE
jgi:hypothetical protein